MSEQQIGELLSPERFKVWIGAQEVGKVGFTADQWNCPLAYYLADGLGVGVCRVEVTEDVIQVDNDTQYTLDNFSWPHHFVIAIDALDPISNKLPVTHEQAITCLDQAVKEAEEWGQVWVPSEVRVECEDCGKPFDYRDGHSEREWDTGATSWYCPECSGRFYEPDDYPTDEDVAQQEAWEKLMRENMRS